VVDGDFERVDQPSVEDPPYSNGNSQPIGVEDQAYSNGNSQPIGTTNRAPTPSTTSKSTTSKSTTSNGSNANYYSCLEDYDDEEEEETLPTQVWIGKRKWYVPNSPKGKAELQFRKYKPKYKCYGCGKAGHYVRDCIVTQQKRQARREQQQQQKKVHTCNVRVSSGPKRSNPDRNYRKRFNKQQRKKALAQQVQDQAELEERYKTLEAEHQALTRVVIKLCTKLGLQGDELYNCIEEHAYVMGEQKLSPGSSIFLGDSGASTHMGNEDEGMYDVQEINDPVTVGNGKVLRATKVGKLKRTVHQVNGSTLDVILPDYKFVPGLHANLFSITKALSSGWEIGNKGVKLTLSKAGHTIEFDRVFKTENGFLCGVELLPRSEQAHPTVDTTATTVQQGKSVKHWNINRLHKVLNHASEEVLRLTAKDYNWTIQGVFEKCSDCHMSNITQKDVPKSTTDKATEPGYRVFIDQTSIKVTSLGGSKYWLVIVDDATGMTWSIFLKRKNEQVQHMLTFFRKMKRRGTPVRKVRCDNAGENKALQEACQKDTDPDICTIEFEFTPRDSPQYNGKCERKIAILAGRTRVALNAAKLPKSLRDKLWTEAGSTVTDVENLLLSRKTTESAHKAFFQKDLPKANSLRQFGEMAIIKHAPSIKGKLTDRGIPVVHMGRAKGHAGDTYRFLNPKTKGIIVSRDAIWLDKVYGEYKGTHKAPTYDTTTVIPKMKLVMAQQVTETDNQPTQQEEAEPATMLDNDATEPPNPATATGPRTRSKGPVTIQPVVQTNDKLTRELQKLASQTINPEAMTLAERVKASNHQSGREGTTASATPTATVEAVGGEQASFAAACCMIDRFGEDFEVLLGNYAFVVETDHEAGRETPDYSKIDPSKYKDMFEAPNTFDEAWNHSDPFQRQRWREAIDKELTKMNDKGVWKKVKRSTMPSDRRCVKHKWVFEIKRSGIFRARLVAKGFSQVAGVDFTSEIFSPVANDISFRILLILMILWDLDTLIFDIETAFLHGHLKEQIFMDCPEGMEHEVDECLLLIKTIYGLVQSARRYFEHFADVLKLIGFAQCKSDPCLFMRRDEDGICIILTYVDDNWTTGHTKAIEKALKQIQEHFRMTIDRELKDYLSCEIVLSKDKKRAWLGQPHMVKKIINTFGEEVKNLQKYRTPGTPGQGLIRPKTEEDKIDTEKHSRYRTGVGMLLFLLKHSRPDLANPVRELTKCLDGATQAAYKEMLRIIKFVMDTKNRGLKIEPKSDKLGEWQLVVYTDSDWAGDKEDRRSISGYMLFLCGVLISWRSKAQKTVSLSSSEAEFYACGEAAKEIPFVVQLLLFLGVKVELPVQVYVDNVGAIFMSENPSSSTRTRHMDTRWHYVNDMQRNGLIKVEFVKSADNISDVETKNVTGEIYDAHIDKYTSNKESVEDHGK